MESNSLSPKAEMERLDGVIDGGTAAHAEFVKLRALTLHRRVKLRDSLLQFYLY